ncbi:hypothetical protein N9C21_00160 [Aquiluna sp.]|nr:hypothetical protein [Aquiluna sp.]
MNSRGIWFGDYLFDPAYKNVLEDFRQMGDRLGFSVRHSREHVDGICLVNFHLRDAVKLIMLKSLRRVTSRMHVVTEPRVIVPALSFKFWRHLGLRRVTLGGEDGTGVFYEKPYLEREMLPLGERREKAVIVNGNKFSWVRGELYSLRRILLFQEKGIDVFGSGWRESRLSLIRSQAVEILRATVSPERVSFGGRHALASFENSRGPCEDKVSTIAQYKVNLVIENSTELVTEKLIDAWMAGCIPVYVGPNLDPHGIPESTYIKASPSLEDLQTALEIALGTDQVVFYKKVSDWLASREFQERWGYFEGWRRILRPLIT